MAVAIPSEDWQTERGVLTANKYMLEHQIHTDIVFSLENANGKFEKTPVSTVFYWRFDIVSNLQCNIDTWEGV
jgi:hypothetical protein